MKTSWLQCRYAGPKCSRNVFQSLLKVCRCTLSIQSFLTFKELLKKQQSKLGRDWGIAKSVAPDTAFEVFRYYWLIVNSRCFFWGHINVQRKGTKRIKRSADDCMALCPFADYFNHEDEGVSVD
jgi:hypothetical protein